MEWDTCKNCKNYIEYICSASERFYQFTKLFHEFEMLPGAAQW
jgi:hypothetical protein